MVDSDDEDELLVTFAVTSVAAAAATFMLDAAATARQRKRRHRVWVNKYLQRRAQYGTYNSLMIDLLELDDVKFCNYVRMPPVFVRHQHQLSDWLRRYNKSTTNRISGVWSLRRRQPPPTYTHQTRTGCCNSMPDIKPTVRESIIAAEDCSEYKPVRYYTALPSGGPAVLRYVSVRPSVPVCRPVTPFNGRSEKLQIRCRHFLSRE